MSYIQNLLVIAFVSCIGIVLAQDPTCLWTQCDGPTGIFYNTCSGDCIGGGYSDGRCTYTEDYSKATCQCEGEGDPYLLAATTVCELCYDGCITCGFAGMKACTQTDNKVVCECE